MPTATLIWTPGGGANSLSQDVQYKVHTDTNYSTAAIVGATVNTYNIPGLLDNTIYDYSIVDNCAVGGPVAGTPFQAINITCPAVSLTPAYNQVQYNFNDLGASITSYMLTLYDGPGANVLATNNAAIGAPVSAAFTGLNPSTNYKVGITVNAGTFSKTCPPQSFTTLPPPPCNAPTNVSATMV
ncbi:MAG TPA: hypothetical protein VGM30_10550 [Puia sp.]|jgi:hypothetical protein